MKPITHISQGPHNQWKVLIILAIAELLALGTWFSASAVAPQLQKVLQLGRTETVFLTASVQLGLVIGSLISASFGLADRWKSRQFFAWSAFGGAVCNIGVIFSHNPGITLFLRLLTGVTLTGIYPIAIKILADWFPFNRGLATGILVGALTVGSLLPRLLLFITQSVAWQWVIAASSILSLASALLVVYFLPEAPNQSQNITSQGFSWTNLKLVIHHRPTMLANVGYFGHMWELYAMWTWLPVFILRSTDWVFTPAFAALWAFLAIGLGGVVGCILGGFFADRLGRTRLTIWSMVISGCCCMIVGWTYHGNIIETLMLTSLWGIAVIADSAQFSAAVTEVAPPQYVGTALTFQMAVGFLITIGSIYLLPWLRSIGGWPLAFGSLAFGPIVGSIAMFFLRKDPASILLAHGNR